MRIGLILLAMMVMGCAKEDPCPTCEQTVTWIHAEGLYQPTSYKVKIEGCDNDTLTPYYRTIYDTPTGIVLCDVVNVCK